MARDNVVSFDQPLGSGRRRVTDARTHELVGKCRAHLAETLPRLMQELFEHIDDELYQLADKSASDVLQTRYFDAMRELRKLRKGIDQSFLHRALGEYDDFWHHLDSRRPAATSLADDSELSLVDNVELEEDLAVTNIVSKAENLYHRELYALDQRLAMLAERDEVKDFENPLGPAALTNSFRHALARWNGDVSVKLVIYKLFERHVMQFVGGLYDEVNDILITADILPKIVQRVRRNPVAPSVQRSRDPAQEHVDKAEPADDGPQGGQQELMSMLGQLLAARRTGHGNVAPAHLPVVPATEVIGALSELQHSIDGAVPANLGEAQANQVQMQTALVQHLGMGNGDTADRRFAQPEQDVIDVISMLFEYILDDRNLPDPMKALLSRLQIPMLKVAILDRGFFASKGHPARRLLNTLARASVGWADEGDRSTNSLYGQVAAAVGRVLSEFSDNIELFTELDNEFCSFLERESRGAEVAEERVTQVNQGQEHLKLARHRVRTELNQRLAAAEVVPEAVRELLADGWKDVMLLALLREGERSDAWIRSLDIVDRLIWSVQPKALNEERQEMLRNIPDLLRALREGFENISIDQYRSAQLFKELQACHIAALRGKSVPSADAPTLEPEAEVVVDGQADQGDSDNPADPYEKQANAFSVGQWLEWQEGNSVLRGKLSWKSAVTGTYVFVNRKGTKLKDMKPAVIADLLRNGRATVIESANKPIMDRALDAMLDALRQAGDVEVETEALPA